MGLIKQLSPAFIATLPQGLADKLISIQRNNSIDGPVGDAVRGVVSIINYVCDDFIP